MTIPSIRTLHGIVRISVVVLLLIALVAGQARGSTPEAAINGSAVSRLSPEPALSLAENERPIDAASLLTTSMQLVLFGVDTFLEMHEQDVSDDCNASAALDATLSN